MKKLMRAVLGLAMVLSVLTIGETSVKAAEGNAARINETEYETLQAAVNAAQDGDEIVLLKDVEEEEVTFGDLVKGEQITLNLNTHTFTSTTDDVLAITASDLDLTILNGTLKGTLASAYGIYAYTGADRLDLVIDNVTIDVADQTLGVQGRNSEQNVTVKNSTIISQLTTAVYFPPKSGTMIIENSTVKAPNQAIVLKGGHTIIRGADAYIEANGKAGNQNKPYDGDPNDPGSFPATGNAVYVEGGYKDRDISLVIEDGTVYSKNNQAVLMQKFDDSTAVRSVVIKKGTFSSDVSRYLAEDGKIVETEDGFIVAPNTEGVTLDASEQTLKVGESTTLHATLTPEGAVEELVWTSSDPTIVTVDANGTITAVKEGSATITVTAGAYRAQCEVTVVAAEDETQDPTTPPTDDEKDPGTSTGEKEPGTDNEGPATSAVAMGGMFASMAVLSGGIVVVLREKRRRNS